jgi:hypothetical protein
MSRAFVRHGVLDEHVSGSVPPPSLDQTQRLGAFDRSVGSMRRRNLRVEDRRAAADHDWADEQVQFVDEPAREQIAPERAAAEDQDLLS